MIGMYKPSKRETSSLYPFAQAETPSLITFYNIRGAFVDNITLGDNTEYYHLQGKRDTIVENS